jgi:hypothetical protein
VTRRPLPAGHRIDLADLGAQQMELSPTVAAHAFRSAVPLLGRALVVPLPAGDLVQDGALAPSGAPGLRPLSLPVDAATASSLEVGQPADMLVTVGDQESASTTVLLRGAEVLAVDRGGGLAPDPAEATVTVGLSGLAEIEAVVQAEHRGTVTVVPGATSDGTGLGTASIPPGPGAPGRGDVGAAADGEPSG